MTASRLSQRIVVIALVSFCLAYICDYFSVRYRIAKHSNPFEDLEIHPYYAVPQKNGRTQFLFDEPRAERCVESLFPHFGDSPCWYLRRRTQRRIDI
jgi:hypothetical protein